MEKNMPLELARKEPETKGRNTSPQVRVRINSFSVQDAMSWVALQMLTGDRAKYMGLIFTIAFSSFLIAQQVSIFAGIMNRTRSQISDVHDADIWVMDPATQYFDQVYSLKDGDVDRVRGVPGVRWAVRLFKGQPRAILMP
jgi:putative ABC transport system permease protein